MGKPLGVDPEIDLERFIRFWTDRDEGSERADAQEFLKQLCAVIGVEPPHEAQAGGARASDYAFERKVVFRHENDATSPGFIDLYKRDCFVLEAKQSRKRLANGAGKDDQLTLAFENALARQPKTKGASPSWDVMMSAAKRQAQGYARTLDEWPPFIIVVDVGNVIELWSDFQRQGKEYVHFPNRNEFRIRMEDLRKAHVRERLRKVWTEPLSLDPARHAAEVTQEIARYLALITQSMERRAKLKDAQKDEWAYKVSKFLMRCIFAMFADSIGLLPKGSFAKLVARNRGKAQSFHHVLDHFFREMNKGAEYSPLIEAKVREFNGGLFHDAASLPMTEDELALLEKAASRDWAHVEPAIFGTLLEQALSAAERAKLGAHHTPRAYVERLVAPVIMEPLNEDWQIAQSEAIAKAMANDYKAARAVVKRFHDGLCKIRVLDPACGTGNFLYVAMELMKRLEGEVFDFLHLLGEPGEPLQTVDPHQFIGIEKNPRAAPIAELVLWIGYIQWWFRTRERSVFQEPILRKFDNIKVGDAVLAHDREELLKDERGRPITRQDPDARKLHPITGELQPDPDARLPVWRYVNPRIPKWPEADFIIGNPPFIGGKDLRAELGDGYVEALWKSRGKKTDSIDFVMYWWDMAASILLAKGSRLRRFGFITTNSITQKFSRRVIEKHLSARQPLSLVYATPDHPWLKQSGKAAVRIAMTVAEAGSCEGVLAQVTSEDRLDTDAPVVALETRVGRINSDLTVGTDLASLRQLASNGKICSRGVQLMGDGFIVTAQQAASLGMGREKGLEQHIRPYRNGRDLAGAPRGVFVIDLFGLSEAEVRKRFPAVYQHVLTHVKPERDVNNRATYRTNWWIFGEPRKDIRPALVGLPRYIATVETAKHRFFQFLDAEILPDNMLVAIASSDAFHLGVLSSRLHVAWALATGGWLGVGNDPRYSKSLCFDPFPFPAASEAHKKIIRGLAEELDALRQRVLAAHDFLTMTKLYNVRERLKGLERGEGPPLDESERAILDAGCVAIIHDLHKRLDDAVADSYGWPRDLSEAETVARLVALNRERAEEERRGLVRWLRPEYQSSSSGRPADAPQEVEAELVLPEIAAEAPSLPTEDGAFFLTLQRTLHALPGPATPIEIARRFRQGGRAAPRIEKGLMVLAVLGNARKTEAGWFIPQGGRTPPGRPSAPT